MAKYSLFNSVKIILMLVLFQSIVISQNLSVASFSRLGFGARGISLGNAMGAVTEGEVTGYYNPAVLPFVNLKRGTLTVGFLSLDRTLDFVHYTQSLYPTAGFSFFLIRAGVKNIDLRDVDGFHIENFKTSEYMFGFSFSNKLNQRFSVGLSLKFYYSEIYHDFNARTLGVDFGFIFKLHGNLFFGFVLQDLNAKYRWDSTNLYGEKGHLVIERFPITKKISTFYKLKDIILLSFDFSFVEKQKRINFGLETYPIGRNLSLRSGFDMFNNPSLSLGFGLRRKFSKVIISFDYAYKYEVNVPLSSVQFFSIGVEI